MIRLITSTTLVAQYKDTVTRLEIEVEEYCNGKDCIPRYKIRVHNKGGLDTAMGLSKTGAMNLFYSAIKEQNGWG